MDRLIHRGEFWLHEFKPPDKRRPVLVLGRSQAIPLLNYVIVVPISFIVVPISFTIHGAPEQSLLEPAKA
ncbi:type II toxin-antitoxin system PemK/MazF family toxin [candidate division KSB1 bacterium]|nr:type II toxin-antitoxin system PemK/MazF family toxin [bacterium]NUM64651.1 type II toxin-antitoxin system PemK/MazF family toxin [candidate division KSB1 bacterium]